MVGSEVGRKPGGQVGGQAIMYVGMRTFRVMWRGAPGCGGMRRAAPSHGRDAARRARAHTVRQGSGAFEIENPFAGSKRTVRRDPRYEPCPGPGNSHERAANA